MADSLVLAGAVQLLGHVPSTIPECAGVIFDLAPGFDFGMAEVDTSAVTSLLLGGEEPSNEHVSNRSLVLPVVIRANTGAGLTRNTLAAARETIVKLARQKRFTVEWTRDQGLPLVFDCYRADAAVLEHSILRDKVLLSAVQLTCPAAPYGRSDVPQIIEFQAPLAGATAPPAKVLIDDYSTVTGTNWVASLLGPGPHSAEWSPGTSGLATPLAYTRSGIGPLNLTGLSALTVWAGLGSSAWFKHWGLRRAGPVTFVFSLTDGTHTASVHATRQVRLSNDTFDPYWQKIRVPIPAGSGLNLAAVTGYTIKAYSRADGSLPYANLYLDWLYAVPATDPVPVQPATGQVYDLAGTLGTAPAPFSLQIQQPAGSALATSKRFTVPGPFTFTAPAGSGPYAKGEAYGPGGRGAAFNGGFGGGAGAGGYAGDMVGITPGTAYSGNVPAGGAGSGGTAGSATFTGDNGQVISAGGGTNMVDGNATGSAGGTGSAPAEQLAGQQGGFEGGIGTWLGASNCSVAATGAQHRTGTGALQMTSTAAGNMIAASCSLATTLTNGEPCDPALPVNVNGFSRAAVSARSVENGAEFVDATGASLGAFYGATVADTTTGFTAYPTANVAPPAGSVRFRVLVQVLATGAGGEVHYTDDMSAKAGVAHTGGAGGNGASPSGGGGGGAPGPGGNGGAGQLGSGTAAGGTTGGGSIGVIGGHGAINNGTNPNPPNGIGAGGGGNAGPGSGGHGDPAAFVLTFNQTAGFKHWLVHRPGPGQPDSLSPFIPLNVADIPDGTTEYPVPSLIAGVAARFSGTYSCYAVNTSWNNPAASRAVTLTVTHYEQSGGSSYTMPISRTLTPNTDLDGPFVLLGELTLPDHAMPYDNMHAQFTVKINSTNTGDRFQDSLFCDVSGSLILVQSPIAYVSYLIDEPPPGLDLGNVMGTMFDRTDAISVLAYADVSGPPLSVDPDGSQALLIYCADQQAPSAEASLWPRWMAERVA